MRRKVATSWWLAVVVTRHVVRPRQAPLQPTKREPLAGRARKTKVFPAGSAFAHVAAQPKFVVVTRPRPTTRTPTRKPDGPKTASTRFSASTTSSQAPAPVQAPRQATKRRPGLRVVAVRRTRAPDSSVVVHVGGHA